MKNLLLGALLAALVAGTARAAVAVDAVLVNASVAHQLNATGTGGGGGTSADLVTATFNVSASRLVVAAIQYESDVTNTATTLTWTGGTPACASGFTLQAQCGYNDGVGDWQGSEVFTAWTTGACTAQGVTHHNAVTIVNGINTALTVWSISGGQQAIPVGSFGCGANSSANGTVNVSITNVNVGSMLLAEVGSAGLNAAITAAANTTIDSNFLSAPDFWSVDGVHVTALTASATTTTFGGTNTGIGFRAAAAIEINDVSIGASTAPPSIPQTGVGRNDPPRWLEQQRRFHREYIYRREEEAC